MTLTLTPSPYVEPLLWDFTAQGYVEEIHTVSYELQRGGNQMLFIKKHPIQQRDKPVSRRVAVCFAESFEGLENVSN